MATSVDICNEALISFGQEPIMTLDESSKSARRCRQLYDSTRKYLLSLHPWSFALKTVTLAPTTDYTSVMWPHAFRRPGDCLKLVNINVPNDEYMIEHTYICCEPDTITISYIVDLEDVNQFSQAFYRCMVIAVAKNLVPSLAEDYNLQDKMTQRYAEALREARHFDSIEQGKNPVFRDDWIFARYQ